MSHVGNDLWADTLSDALDERNATLKETLNSLEATVVEFRQEYDAMLPVVDAAIAYVHAVHMADHVKYSRVKHWQKNLMEEVAAYEESKL